MSFSINALVLYSHTGQKRIVSFNRTGLNIITGQSKTGKSAIIDIVDYCLGRGSFNVAEGRIRKGVSWFALHLVKLNGSVDDELFIARDNPGPGASTGSQVFVQRGHLDVYPELQEIQKNYTEAALRDLVTRYCAIKENEHRPASGTRLPLQANIAHALWLCFQKQNTIASQDQLFHRMNEQLLPQAMKDTLPYFMGAVDENHFRLLAELDELVQKLKRLEVAESRKISVAATSRNRISRILNEGKKVGLIRQDIQPVDDTIFSMLEQLSKTAVDTVGYFPDFGETIENLRGEQRSLQNKLTALNHERRAAQAFLSDQTEYSREMQAQQARLKSVNIFKGKLHSVEHCPFCESVLKVPVPTISEMRTSLEKVEKQLAGVFRDSPHVQSHLNSLDQQITQASDTLRILQFELNRVVREDAAAKARQDLISSRERFLGRLSEFLESIKPTVDIDDNQEQLTLIKEQIDAARSRLNTDELDARMATILGFIGVKMTDYADGLDLEHSGSSLRLDLKRLTVIADTMDGPIPLNRMGSGENWVGYHVLAHLAVHWWLRQKNRPVPSFLIFDQPTQAYYPPDRTEGGLDQIEKDEDRKAVQALFKLMFTAVNEINHGFQLIVLDHAHLSEKWFEDAIIEEWRGSKALVPDDWPDK